MFSRSADSYAELGQRCSFLNLSFSVVNLLLNGGGVETVDGAANGDACAEDFFDGADKLSGVRLGSHLLGDINDLIKLDLAVVNDVLGLLTVTWGFLEGLEDKGSGGGVALKSAGFLSSAEA
jgi:hypothetical protein